jgi:hypothetical protein
MPTRPPTKFADQGFVATSRLMPRIYSDLSRRELTTIPENCSLCHLIVNFDPTIIGVPIRKHTPPGDLSSIVAGATRGVRVSSSHEAVTRVMAGDLGSFLISSTHSLSANDQTSSVSRPSAGKKPSLTSVGVYFRRAGGPAFSPFRRQ